MLMRKFLTVSLILLLLSFRIAGIAFAAETASAEIPVVIDGGGTAYMTPEVNSPQPKENTISVDNGRTGQFHIDFTEAGEYHYTITADFNEDGGKRAADESFRLTVTVYERDDGSLYTVSVIHSRLTDEKPDKVRFRRTQETTTQPDETTTQPDETTTQPEETTTKPEETTTKPEETTTRPEEKTTRPTETTTRPTEYTTRPFETTTRPTETTTRPNPKTGDESHLLRYVMIAVASSAGLFCLALLYTVNTKRLIREE